MDRLQLRDDLLGAARRRGFATAGVASLEPFETARARGLAAIAAGRMDGMPWFSPARVEAASDLGARYPWGRSLLALAWPYRPAALGEPAPPPAMPGRPRGRMAAYACSNGDGGAPVDYHDHLGQACDDLVAWLRERVPGTRAKRFVDHGWAADRAVAERAGLGFSGKNSCVLGLEAGSYTLLASLLLDIELPPTPPSLRDCGTCRACVDACPTAAIVEPGAVDARRCISYLTIEHRGPIADDLRVGMGRWVFGCDVCQEACPVNHRLAPTPLEPGPAVDERGPVPWPDLSDLLALDDDGFAARYRGTAVWRTGRAGMVRNAAIAAGNAGDAAALPALRRARDHDGDAVVREAAAWGCARLEAAG